MCGIAGVVYYQSRPREAVLPVLEAMNRAQSYRGPDGDGVWTDGRVGLAHVRLALVGDAERGHEPLADETGAQLIFNGEIYRPAELMRSWGLEFAPGESDARTLHALLRRQGPDGLAEVEGPFAAARYDPAAGKVTLIRDLWGQKPLYLWRRPEGIYFASTVAALRAAVGPLTIRPEALLEYLIYRSVGGRRSAFQEIEQLPPGSWLEVAVDGSERSGQWYHTPAPDRFDARPSDVRERVDFAVAERLDPQLEQGIFLSGGLDSSIVATSAVLQANGSPLRFYSIGYDVSGVQDERHLARRLADNFDYEYQEIQLSAGQIPELFLDVARILEDPIQDPVTLPTLLLSRAAAGRTRCVLTGDGSDEFWGGYERFDDPPRDLADYFPRTAIFQPQDLGLSSAPASYLDQVEMPPENWAPLDRILAVEARNRLRNYHLARVDKLSMGCGLEIRCPFLDRQVTSLAMSIPAENKRLFGVPKGLLIEAYRRVLPEWLVERKKQPFSMPILQWLHGDLQSYARDRLGPNSRTASLVSAQPYLENLNEKSAAKIWSLLVLEAWMEVWA
ncbi:asparagine synthase (glutamine-hydrolyzing) [bacterium SCN 62-11]|nr:asparagine synthase (glutamine-hydrolyzing) [Candidatus Eremiobacteraeota bacterium]ODT58719.1 MAG: asparagine synthase (glutamine-hydrolyzing) [bacterium SCN 62-11]